MSSPGLKAILLTDLVDSTGTTERTGAAAAARLWAQHDRCARDLLVAWRGREIDKSDGFLLMFDGVDDAAGYALEYHRTLAGGPTPLAARAGLHVAALELHANAADDVARGAKPFELADWLQKALAARVMALAPGGRTLLTAQAAQAMPHGARIVVSAGHWQLQGMVEPVELFELCAQPGPRAPLPDGTKGHAVVRRGERWVPRREIPNTLPAERDAFVGRQAALQTIAHRVAQGARCVSILGAGGIGKTRVALRYARDWIGDHPGGVWFCDLSTAQGLDGIVYAVAQGLGLRLTGIDPVRQIGEALRGRPGSLVILDNFEQIVGAAPGTVGRWLADCPDTSFLITTRSALHLAGESLVVLPPLANDEAAALFAQRAVAAGAEPDDVRPGLEAVEALAKLLDGVPLALELAAARAGTISPAALLARMGERFRLLRSVGGARPERQATLRATLDWSWDLLGPADRVAFARLSVFAGSFRLNDAEVVLGDLAVDGEAGLDDAARADRERSGGDRADRADRFAGPSLAAPAPGTDGIDALDAVQSLLDHSMLRRVAHGRFALLPSVRDYAGERLRSTHAFPGSGPALQAAVERRHWVHCAAFDEREAAADDGAALDDLIAACRRATAAGEALHAAGALRGVWSVLGLTGPFREAVRLGRAVERLGGMDASTRCSVQRVLADASETLGEVDAARLAHESALAAASESGQPAALASALCGLGQHLYKRGDATAARGHLDRALALAVGLGDAALLGEVQNALGTLENRLGRSAPARARYVAALAHARSIGNVRLEGGILGNLAMLAHEQAADDAAQHQYEEALALTRQVNDRRWEGNTRCNLGLLLQERGATDAARAEFETALAIAREIGHPMLEATLQCNLGILAGDRGDHEAARIHHAEALRLAQRSNDKRAEGQFRGYLGACLARLGLRDDAFTALDAAERCLREAGDDASLGLLACQRATAAHGFEMSAMKEAALAEAGRVLADHPSGELRTAIEAVERGFGGSGR